MLEEILRVTPVFSTFQDDVNASSVCPLESIGKQVKFMLKEVASDASANLQPSSESKSDNTDNAQRQRLQPKWCFNERILDSLLCSRAKYLLAAASHLMCRPAFNAKVPAGPSNRKFIFFDDLDEHEVELLHMVLKELCSSTVGISDPTFVCNVEARFAFQNPGSECDTLDSWPAMWSKVLMEVVKRGAKELSAQEVMDPSFQPSKLLKLLPAPARMCPKSFYTSGGGGPEASSTVKTEELGKQVGQSSAQDSGLASSSGPPSFYEVLHMHEIPNAKAQTVNVMDVLVLKSTIEAHIFTHAL